MHYHKGIYTVFDGIDRVGKGVLIETVLDYEKAQGRTVFDADQYQELHQMLPTVDNFKDFDIVMVSEPTFCGLGKHIRDNLTAKGSTAPVEEIAGAFSDNRYELLNKVILPALKLGINVITSRSVCSSLVYQPLDARIKGVSFTLEDVMSLTGNQFALENTPNLLIIPIIGSVSHALKRSEGRGKDDDCKYEVQSFLEQSLKLYQSDWLREIYESRGTTIEFVDTSDELEDSVRNVLDVWGRHFS